MIIFHDSQAKKGKKNPFTILSRLNRPSTSPDSIDKTMALSRSFSFRAEWMAEVFRPRAQASFFHRPLFRACSGYPNIRSSGCLLWPMDIRSSGCRGGGIHMSFIEVRPAASGGIGPSHSSFTMTNQLLISASVELFWLIIAQQS